MATTTSSKRSPSKSKTEDPSPSASLTNDEKLELLRQVYLARYFDVRLIKEKKRGRLRGTLYSSHNQEAVLVGSLFGLKPNDWISPVHRDMPAFFLKDLKAGWDNDDRKGLSIEKVCSQVWGKADSPGRARDNWTHIGSYEKKIIHSTSMLGGTVPVAAGVVYADRQDGGDAVVLTFNGEGATANGAFHEGVNFAAVRKLPMVTVVENNQWAYGTPLHLGSPVEDVARRADGYGIPGWVADGQNVFDVYDKVKKAIEYGRAGNGPSIVECKTYRAYGHGDHDDDRANRYRPEEEIEEGRRRDPIGVAKKILMEEGILSEEEAKRYPAEGLGASDVTDEDFPPEVVEFLNRGVEFAMKSEVPEGEEGGYWVFRE